MRRVTINDVARAAGVSVSTISKVVNKRDGIAPETQRRVQQVIDDLGYVGSVGARSLRARRTGVVGVLVSQFEPYSAEILKGVGLAAQSAAVEIMAWAGASNGPYAPTGWEHALLGRLAGSLIDGAIMVTPSSRSRSGAFPVVAVDPHAVDPLVPSLSVDDEGGARSAVVHLLELGHTRIGYLGGREDLESATARERGFRRAMQEAGPGVDERLVQHGDYTAAGAEVAATLLLDAPDPPTAVVAANDVSALQVIQAARARQLELPGELSVVGFDNIPEAAQHGLGLTTVAQPLQDIGAQALKMLLELLDGRRPEQMHVRMPTTLLVRESTAPPRQVLGSPVARMSR